MNKRPDITENTKNALKDAFWKLYEETPIEKISIKEITDLAGYNRGTFYLYYKDVYDILEQFETSILEDADIYFNSLLENQANVSVKDLMDSVMALYRKHSRHMNVMFGEHGSPRFKRKFKNKIKQILYEAIYRDAQKEASSLKAEYLLEFYVSGLLNALQLWHSNREDFPVQQFGELMYEIFTNGAALWGVHNG